MDRFKYIFFFNLHLQLCALNSISYYIQYRERKREINPLVNEIVFPRLFRAQTYDFPEIILPIPFETSFLTLVVVSTRMFRNDSTNRVEKRTRLIYIYTYIIQVHKEIEHIGNIKIITNTATPLSSSPFNTRFKYPVQSIPSFN